MCVEQKYVRIYTVMLLGIFETSESVY